MWKMMSMDEKARIKQAFDRQSDGYAVMWGDTTSSVALCFTDVKNLVRHSSIYGNVIDAYVELLKTEQVRMFGGDDLVDKSYFFSSVCLDLVRNQDIRVIEKYIRMNISARSEYQYMHFPMCHLGHWTLMVNDTKDVRGSISIQCRSVRRGCYVF
ncbi:hypothetical protein CsSME_00054129 [Camellia sinensis var. sinensis]